MKIKKQKRAERYEAGRRIYRAMCCANRALNVGEELAFRAEVRKAALAQSGSYPTPHAPPSTVPPPRTQRPPPEPSPALERRRGIRVRIELPTGTVLEGEGYPPLQQIQIRSPLLSIHTNLARMCRSTIPAPRRTHHVL